MFLHLPPFLIHRFAVPLPPGGRYLLSASGFQTPIYHTVFFRNVKEIIMEQKFILSWADARERALELGVRMRPVKGEEALAWARRSLSGGKVSDGFWELAQMGRLDLSLEALAVDSRFTALFTDDQANTALNRLLEAGYGWKK